jgi:hypothetical protein
MADEGSELDFFGAKIKVKNPRLAALLNSSVTENVEVIGRRTKDLFGGDEKDEDLNAALDEAGAAGGGDERAAGGQSDEADAIAPVIPIRRPDESGNEG